MQILDWIVIGLYAAALLVVGYVCGRKVETEEDYLLGGRTMRPTAVGLSMFATLFSTITYLAFPGEMIRHGPMILAGLIAYPLVFWIVGWFLIPHFMRLRVTSGYELLERRLGVGVRMIGVSMFLLLRLLWMSVIIYATADIVLVPLLGLSSHYTPLLCLVMTVLTIIYTSMGGLRAVVLTDVIQTMILFCGAIIALVLLTWWCGGIEGWFPSTWSPQWDPLAVIQTGENGRSILVAFVAGVVWFVSTSGSDQMAIQRYLATRDIQAARQVMSISLIANTGVQLLLAAVGFALLGFYQSNPELIPGGANLVEQADRLFPAFIVYALPMGLSGLVIAGLLAAAMSSLSSGLNSVCAVVSVDLIGRFHIGNNGKNHVTQSRWISVVIGLIVIALSTGVASVEGNLLELTYKVVNLFVAPLFGLFVMALFVKWATGLGTILGAIAGMIVVGLINFWTPLTGHSQPPIGFMWAMPCGLLVQVLVGMLASWIPGAKQYESLDHFRNATI